MRAAGAPHAFCNMSHACADLSIAMLSGIEPSMADIWLFSVPAYANTQSQCIVLQRKCILAVMK